MEKPSLKFTSSWDDGHIDDFKIAGILKALDLPGTFYIPDLGMFDKDDVSELHKMGFEIGGHTVSHVEDLKLLSDEDLEYEIRVNKEHLEDCIGEPITKFCYPGGRYDDRVIEAVKKAGYNSARTTVVLKDKARDDFRVDTTIHVYPRKEYEGKDWVTIAKEQAGLISQSGGVFHIWGHAVDLNNYDQWSNLTEFFKCLKNEFEIINV